MNIEMAKAIVEAGSEDETLDIEVRESYSGRSSYGKETTGLVCADYATFIRAIAAYSFLIGDNEGDYGTYYELQDFLREMKWDNMGRQIIIY